MAGGPPKKGRFGGMGFRVDKCRLRGISDGLKTSTLLLRQLADTAGEAAGRCGFRGRII